MPRWWKKRLQQPSRWKEHRAAVCWLKRSGIFKLDESSGAPRRIAAPQQRSNKSVEKPAVAHQPGNGSQAQSLAAKAAKADDGSWERVLKQASFSGWEWNPVLSQRRAEIPSEI